MENPNPKKIYCDFYNFGDMGLVFRSQRVYESLRTRILKDSKHLCVLFKHRMIPFSGGKMKAKFICEDIKEN